MLGSSSDLRNTLAGNHTAAAAMRVLNQVDTPTTDLTDHMSDASVTADRSGQYLRNMTGTVGADDGIEIPESMASELGPASRLQLLRGARIENVVTVGELCNTQAAWNNITTPVGQMVGVIANSSGELQLGP